MNRTVRAVLVTAVFLGTVPLAGGCYTILGAEHNYTVSKKLRRGMSLDEALAVLNEGGWATVHRTFERHPACGWTLGLADQPEHEIVRRWEEENRSAPSFLHRILNGYDERKVVQRAVLVRRHWGFMGWGTFLLFLDGEGRLLGHHLEHIN
ncbi:MAG: hypothetical protein JXQ29_15150 [Planctomycetes bacterium]|nr:hypothetical protein [Planctomycetota bacterium]